MFFPWTGRTKKKHFFSGTILRLAALGWNRFERTGCPRALTDKNSSVPARLQGPACPTATAEPGEQRGPI